MLEGLLESEGHTFRFFEIGFRHEDDKLFPAKPSHNVRFPSSLEEEMLHGLEDPFGRKKVRLFPVMIELVAFDQEQGRGMAVALVPLPFPMDQGHHERGIPGVRGMERRERISHREPLRVGTFSWAGEDEEHGPLFDFGDLEIESPRL